MRKKDNFKKIHREKIHLNDCNKQYAEGLRINSNWDIWRIRYNSVAFALFLYNFSLGKYNMLFTNFYLFKIDKKKTYIRFLT